jgi:hypothetical protein
MLFHFRQWSNKRSATVVRFQIDTSRYQPGDVLLVLSGSEVHFHGMISHISMDGPSLVIGGARYFQPLFHNQFYL